MSLTACSSNSSYEAWLSNNKSYPDIEPLVKLHIPTGMILPIKNDDYDIPDTNESGDIGKKLDIRPPSYSLELACLCYNCEFINKEPYIN